MKRILISGYYGFNNNGDEAILEQMLDNLRATLGEAEITVLSKDPVDTEETYKVRAVGRMNPAAILSEVIRCNLLVSGGGSLLQDATSKRSLLYYLAIIKLAKLFGKKVFIYSQGIGPINDEKNRKMTADCLRRTDGIVVRDIESKALLEEIGVTGQEIHVTADPVVRARRPSLEIGEKLLQQEGCYHEEGRFLVGWAMKEAPGEEEYTERQMEAIRRLVLKYDCDVLLIPFHSAQDPAVARKMFQQLSSEPELKGKVWLLRGHHSAKEMLSVVGNLHMLVGVRLHSLIYAAVMNVPMLGISYDPKIDSFLNSLGIEPVSTLYDFSAERFEERFEYTVTHYAELKKLIKTNMAELKRSLSLNEEIIADLLGIEKEEPPAELPEVPAQPIPVEIPGAETVSETASGIIVVDKLEESTPLPETIADVEAESEELQAALPKNPPLPDEEEFPEQVRMAEVPAEAEEQPAKSEAPAEAAEQPAPTAPDISFLEKIYGSSSAEKAAPAADAE